MTRATMSTFTLPSFAVCAISRAWGAWSRPVRLRRMARRRSRARGADAAVAAVRCLRRVRYLVRLECAGFIFRGLCALQLRAVVQLRRAVRLVGRPRRAEERLLVAVRLGRRRALGVRVRVLRGGGQEHKAGQKGRRERS